MSIKHAILAAALCTTVVSNANAAVLFSDNFDSETLSLNGSLSQWTVSNGTIDVIGLGFIDLYPGNGRYLDLDGSTSDAGRITTAPLAFNVSQTYKLTFSYGRNGALTESMTFGVAGSFSDPFVLSGNTSTASLQTFTRVFVAGAASGALFFDHAGGDGAGIILDNVLLQTVDATVVPVPAALPLMVAGLAGLGVAARRRR